LGERQSGKDKTNKRLEKIVLGIFTVFSLAMSVSAFLLEWSVLAKEAIVAAVIAGWVVCVKEYRSYAYRAEFISLMCWINFFIYAIYSSSFTSMLSTMMALIVLLSIFCVEKIVYMGVLFTTVLCFYHVGILHTYSFETANDVLRLILHIAAAYMISLVVWITIRIRKATSEQLMENIRELEIVEKSKDDFMANISHEIRTPINAVCGMSEALLQENLPEDVRRDIIDIQTAGRNLAGRAGQQAGTERTGDPAGPFDSFCRFCYRDGTCHARRASECADRARTDVRRVRSGPFSCGGAQEGQRGLMAFDHRVQYRSVPRDLYYEQWYGQWYAGLVRTGTGVYLSDVHRKGLFYRAFSFYGVFSGDLFHFLPVPGSDARAGQPFLQFRGFLCDDYFRQLLYRHFIKGADDDL